MTDWQKGDLAQCVHPTTWIPAGADCRCDDIGTFSETFCKPVVGSIYTILDLMVHGPDLHGGDEGDVLYLLPEGFLAYFDARLFVKVTPPKDMTLDKEELSPSLPVEA